MKRFPFWLRAILFLAIAAGVLLFFYHCPFRYLFGVSCMGCGMTRALMAAVFRDMQTAFFYHPMLPMLLPVGLYIALRVFCRMQVPPRRENAYILLLFAAMTATYIVRLCAGDPVLAPDFDRALLGRVLAAVREILS